MDKVKRYRECAEEMLAMAAATTDKEARETLLTVAEDYSAEPKHAKRCLRQTANSLTEIQT